MAGESESNVEEQAISAHETRMAQLHVQIDAERRFVRTQMLIRTGIMVGNWGFGSTIALFNLLVIDNSARFIEQAGTMGLFEGCIVAGLDGVTLAIITKGVLKASGHKINLDTHKGILRRARIDLLQETEMVESESEQPSEIVEEDF
jgi:hypothetical protein